MKILITGVTGFVGRHLCRALNSSDNTLYGLTHTNVKVPDGVTAVTLDELKHQAVDAVINLAGQNIAAARWTPARKQALYDSRVTLTKAVLDALPNPPKTVISMSAVGYYGTHPTRCFNEFTQPIPGYTHELCQAWEDAAKSAESEQTRVAILRLGVVLGDGGALEKMRLPFLFGAGGPIGDGEHWFPWVHIEDVINIIITSLNNSEYRGPINVVSPEAVKQKTFAKAYAHSLKRPAFIPTPKLVMSALFGEMSELLTAGQKVIPERLQQLHYSFIHPNLTEALTNIEQQRINSRA
jgi:uncharacterized protein (TIGR01777 family)